MADVTAPTDLDLHGVLERAELPDFVRPVPLTRADRQYACAIAIVELGYPAAAIAIGGMMRPGALEPRKETEERWT
jgi:hypothetical protein